MLRKSAPVFNSISSSNIDSANGVIKQVVIINAGEDKLGDNIDEVFLQQIAEQGNAQSQGVKCRFGHPNLCDDALGTFVGRYKNFAVTPSNVTADLFLDPVARNSPKGNLHDYILEFAQKNNDMFGNSIVFRQGDSEFKKVTENGNETEKEFIRLKALVASDLVDSPAATNSLFKSDDDFASKATEFLDENEEIFERISNNPKVFAEFLIKYSNYKSLKSKAMDKSKSETLLSEIKSIATEVKEKLFGKKKAILDITAADGTVLHVDDSDDSGSPQVGDGVTVDGQSNPDGSYVMPDSSTIVVANGVISSIQAAAAPPPPPPPPPGFSESPEFIAMKAENEKLAAELKSKSDELEKLNQSLEEVKKEMVEFKDTVKSTYKPEERKQTFRKTADLNEEENKVEEAHRRREEREKQKNNKHQPVKN